MDQTPTQLFESYEADFQLLLSGIKDKLEGSGKSLQGGVCTLTFTRIKGTH